MKKYICLLLSYLLICTVNAQNSKIDTISQSNYIYLSFGAPAIYCGISYEHIIYQKNKVQILPRAGIGFNFLKPSLGNEFDLHTGITLLYGKKAGKMEMSMGFIHYFVGNYDLEIEKNTFNYKPILYGVIGYRYEFKNIPIILKFGITPVLVFNKDRKVFFPLAEFGFGYKL
jgi:hypothetical protein